MYIGSTLSQEAIISLSVLVSTVFSVLITSIIWSILTYYCCVKKKQNERRDLKRQQRDIYEVVGEQDKKYEEVKMHQSPAYATVEQK